MVKAKLESEEITCFLFDENMVTLYPLYNITVGGIKLKINKKDEKKARKILLEFSNSKLLDDEGNPIQCPNCKSNEIYSGFKSMKGCKGVLSAIVSFFFLLGNVTVINEGKRFVQLYLKFSLLCFCILLTFHFVGRI